MIDRIDVEDGIENAVKIRTGINLNSGDEQNNARIQHNWYVCSHRPDGHHLTTGHVLLIEDCLWVCLTPACDMEIREGQKNRRGEYYSPALPFKAVQLHKANSTTALANITSNLYLFLDVGKGIEAFSFVEDVKTEPAPHWLEMYAHNQSEFQETLSLNVSIPSNTDDEWKPVFVEREAQIVAQLRYEYAINLMQRLGSNLSRIGLEFV